MRPINKIAHTALFFGCLPVLASCNTSGASIKYFDVPGVTIDQAVRQAERRSKGPVSVTTGMTLTLDTKKSGAMCRITNVEIKSDISADIPRWTDLNKADQSNREIMRSMSKYIDWYVQQHIDIYQRNRNNIIREVKAIEPQPTCEIALKKARTVFNEGTKKHDKEQRAFERKADAEIERQFRSL